MGRKIPAKKHKGVKDPLIQQARRLETLKLKINAPPNDPDDQPVPRSLTRLFAFKDKQNKDEDYTKKQKLKRFTQTQVIQNSTSVKNNPISRLRRLPGESGRDFSLRINGALKALHNPVESLDYPQDVEVDDFKGEQMAAQRERRARKRAKGKKGITDEPQLNRAQRLAIKKKEKKMKAIQVHNMRAKAGEEKQEVTYDRVSFGEVSHAPPLLNFSHKKLYTSEGTGAPRPGRCDLLLSSLLSGAAGAPADVLRREQSRLAAVAAYRLLKANKIKEKNK